MYQWLHSQYPFKIPRGQEKSKENTGNFNFSMCENNYKTEKELDYNMSLNPLNQQCKAQFVFQTLKKGSESLAICF